MKASLRQIMTITAVFALGCGGENQQTNPFTGAGTGATGGVLGVAGAAGAAAAGGAQGGGGGMNAMPVAGTSGAMPGGTSGTGGAMPATSGTGGDGAAGDPGVGGAAGGGDSGAGGMPSAGGGLKPADSVEGDGPYMAMREEGVDGGAGWLFRPTELGTAGEKHPVLVWGSGATAYPMNYVDHLTQIATHGFVVYACNVSGGGTNAAALRGGLDWLFAENERSGGEMHQKLDLTKVSVGGHSMGSLATYDVAGDERIHNTIHVDGGSFDGTGGGKLKKPALFICGENSTGTANCNRDYMGANVPIFYTRIAGLEGLAGHVAAAREGLPLWIAWMRWQLAGEEERRGDFLDPSCTFCMGKWDSQQKNWQ